MSLYHVYNKRYSHCQVSGAPIAGRPVRGVTNSVSDYTTTRHAKVWHLALPSPDHGLYLAPIPLLVAVQRAPPNGQDLRY
jgi:hypothetical protein